VNDSFGGISLILKAKFPKNSAAPNCDTKSPSRLGSLSVTSTTGIFRPTLCGFAGDSTLYFCGFF
jgi:hypothetical protein